MSHTHGFTHLKASEQDEERVGKSGLIMNYELKLRDFPWWCWSLEDCELSFGHRHVTTHINLCWDLWESITPHLLQYWTMATWLQTAYYFCKSCSHVPWKKQRGCFWPEHALRVVRKGCGEVLPKFPPMSWCLSLILRAHTGRGRSPESSSNTRGLKKWAPAQIGCLWRSKLWTYRRECALGYRGGGWDVGGLIIHKALTWTFSEALLKWVLMQAGVLHNKGSRVMTWGLVHIRGY